MTAELNSLEKVKLCFEYTEDDAFHDFLIQLHKRHLKKEREKRAK